MYKLSYQDTSYKSQKALDLATKGHQFQKRKLSELPYIVHPISVVDQLKKWGVEKDWAHTVAYIHDLLEDTSVSPDAIRKKFGPKILKSVQQLSHLDQNKTKDEWIEDLAKNAGDYIILIKLSDRINNTRDFITNGAFERAHEYWKKSQPFVLRLQSRFKLDRNIRQNVMKSIDELNQIFKTASNLSMYKIADFVTQFKK